MRGMLLENQADLTSKPLRLQQLPLPEPAADEVRIKVTVCGICRTDIHILEGDLPLVTRPIVPGHQVVGTVHAIGSRVENFRLGDRVGLAWLQRTCRQCEFCQSGRENLCLKAAFTGYHVHGGFAEYVVAPTAFTYPIPSQFHDDEAAPLLCAGIIGYRALRLSQVQPGQRLGLYGFGASAHIVIQIAQHWGCEVYVCSLDERHQALARSMGAVWVGGVMTSPPKSLHSAIIFAPAGELVPPALRALERGGTLALAGIHMSAIPVIDYDHELFGERTIRSVTANTKQDGLDLLQEAARIPLRPQTQAFPLDQANEALLALKTGAIQGAGVLRM